MRLQGGRLLLRAVGTLGTRGSLRPQGSRCWGRRLSIPAAAAASSRLYSSASWAEAAFRDPRLQRYLKKIVTEPRETGDDEVVMEGKEVKEVVMSPGKKATVAAYVKHLQAKREEMRHLDSLLHDCDEEMRKLAEEENENCKAKIHELQEKVLALLLPGEEEDEGELLLEVYAGVGGQEAMLFTAEVFEMYENYALHQNWCFERLQYQWSEMGGLRHATACITGEGAYRLLCFEGGVHRVQRIPRTESKGRVHTSTITVAVLRQPSEIELNISPKELRIETKRASGAGGQSVNTTDSSVRITHLPTGVVSECQKERSQIQNLKQAMTILRAKLYDLQLEERLSKQQTARKLQVGSRGRSEKIRTYNFMQDRITDHRIGRTVHGVAAFLEGGEALHHMVAALQEVARSEALAELLGSYDEGAT
ncbi:peptide chain release factor 1-like, mitochondrial [Petromyzon marinus]|uniref:Peptide chain release factor 1-like, mitochondrial n=2 Tax=Petromyzon marinus TaxID=7757 RepID=A0AAJ7TI64_PETMA|nr:peptide chain release factor 1-like, mitochondrial [Petromyzon marinus]